MLNPIHLRTLVTVIRTGSFADAARTLGYTGSAVSQQIAALERAVRMPLFEREAHSIRPTPAGESLAVHARDVLAGLVALEEQVAGVNEGESGRLRVGSFPTASERLVPQWLAGHTERFPNLEVRLDEGEPDQTLGMLVDGVLDLAVTYRYDLVPYALPKGLRQLPLLDEDVVVLLPSSHRLAEGGQVELGDLAGDLWINTSEGTACATCLRRMAGTHDFEPIIGYRSNNYSVIGGLVAAGLGVALVPALGHRGLDGVRALPIAGNTVRRHVNLVHRNSHGGAAVGHACEALARTASELARTVDGLHIPDRAAH